MVTLGLLINLLSLTADPVRLRQDEIRNVLKQDLNRFEQCEINYEDLDQFPDIQRIGTEIELLEKLYDCYREPNYNPLVDPIKKQEEIAILLVFWRKLKIAKEWESEENIRLNKTLDFYFYLNDHHKFKTGWTPVMISKESMEYINN